MKLRVNNFTYEDLELSVVMEDGILYYTLEDTYTYTTLATGNTVKELLDDLDDTMKQQLEHGGKLK